MDSSNDGYQPYTRIPPPQEGGGISQDLVSDSHKSMAVDLICSICLEIIYNPVMCAKCENLFCKDCITKQLQKSNKCPNQCIYIEKEMNRMLRILLNKLEFKCYYYKKGCSTVIILSNFLKHIQNCDFGDFQCNSPGCNYIGIKNDIQSHVEVCQLRLMFCCYCDQKIIRAEFASHLNECENKQVQCSFCSNLYINKTLQSHIEQCDEVVIKCQDCETLLKKKEIPLHDQIACMASQIAYWKEKYAQLEKENLALNERINECERKNKTFLNISTKLFEGRGSNGTSIIETASRGLFSSENFPNQINASHIETMRSLSGLIYTIVDLTMFKNGYVCCGNFNSILVFTFSPFEKKITLDGHTSYIWSIVHLNLYDVNYIASGSQDNTIKIWNLQTKQCVRTLTGHENWVTTVTTIKTNTNLIISSSYDHTVRIWHISTGTCMKVITNVYGKSCVNAFYFKDSYILYGSPSNYISVYDYESDLHVMYLKGHENLINCFANLGEYRSNYIASGSDDKTIKIWDLEDGLLVASLNGHTQCITFVQHLTGLYARNSIIASGSDDHTIRLWSLEDRSCISILKIHESWVKSMLYIKSYGDGTYILSHGDTGAVKLSKLVLP